MKADPAGIEEACALLRSGGVVALPTDTLYGLCADALDPEAVARVLRLKGRSAARPVPVLLADASDSAALAAGAPGGALRKAAEAFWPGPLTLVVDARAGLPPGVVGEDGGIGLRVPESALFRRLCGEVGRPLTGTSANPTGLEAPRTADAVARAFRDAAETPDLLLDGGPCPLGEPSTVLDLRGPFPRVLREGAVARDRLREVLGRVD